MKKHQGFNRRTENLYFKRLFKLVHPEGPHCPECGAQEGIHICRRHKQSWVADVRCSHCGCVFNAWTGTPFQGTHHRPSQLWRIITLMKEGQFKTEMAKELHCQRARLSEFCHRIQRWVTTVLGSPPKKPPRKRSAGKVKKPRSTRKLRS